MGPSESSLAGDYRRGKRLTRRAPAKAVLQDREASKMAITSPPRAALRRAV